MAKHITRSLLKTLRTSWLLVLGGLAVAACSHPTGTETDVNDEISGDDASFTGTGKPENLTLEERTTYQSDWKYVNAMMPSNTPVQLNHADERQHRFVAMRLKMAGKTRENSPELYRRLDETRALHLAQGLKPGQFVPRPHGELGRSTDLGRVPEHYLSSVNILSSTSMESVSTGSRIDPITYGYIDSGTWDSSGAPLGDMNYVEVYTNMPYKSVASTGNLSLTSLADFTGDSMLIEDTVSFGHREFYVKAVTSRGPSLSVPALLEPSDHTGDGCYSICLNRTWTGDCDVDLTSTTQALKVPLKGSITVGPGTQGYKLNVTKINQYKNGTATDPAGNPDPGGSINVVLKSDGGGCAAAGTQFPLSMQAFWQNVTVTNDSSGNPVMLSWDMTGANAAMFNQACRVVQDSLQLDINVVTPWLTSSGIQGITSVAFSNNPQSTAQNRIISCMKETNSCLAAGTQIEMADGSPRAIERIQGGDRVFDPFHQGDLALTVADTAKGFEAVPMVRVEDERGHSLLMTEMHPIQVEGRGMVMAKYLQTGDVVTTKEGPSHLVRVSREKYDGTVYNLKVGSAEEVQSLGQDQTVVYANGFLVGDGQIQSKYESLELQAKAHPARVQVPARWRTDRLNSAHRH